MTIALKESLEKALLIARAAIDKKALAVQVLDLTECGGFTDYFVICSGSSDRQAQAITENVEFELKQQGYQAHVQEGYREGRWILTDFGDVVLHVFLEPLRDYYDLESLWAEARKIPVPSEFYGVGASREN